MLVGFPLPVPPGRSQRTSVMGRPQNADRAIREEKIDLVLLGRPALANAHWPVWAARELGHADPFSLVPEDWAWWLRNFRGHEASIGWPAVHPQPVHSQPGQAKPAELMAGDD